jgi:hypothetical protein
MKVGFDPESLRQSVSVILSERNLITELLLPKKSPLLLEPFTEKEFARQISLFEKSEFGRSLTDADKLTMDPEVLALNQVSIHSNRAPYYGYVRGALKNLSKKAAHIQGIKAGAKLRYCIRIR